MWWYEFEHVDLETLSDEQILALSYMMLDEDTQEEFSDLLWQNREGELTEQGRAHLDELMNIYRRGMILKALTLVVAVQRGLRPPLSQTE